MKKAPSTVNSFVWRALIFSCTVFVSAALNEPGASQAAQATSVEVTYEGTTGLVTIKAADVGLDYLLETLSVQTGFNLDVRQKEPLKKQTSIQIERMPLEQALRKLLDGLNCVFFYSAASDGSTTGSARISTVVVGLQRLNPDLETFPIGANKLDNENLEALSKKKADSSNIPGRADAEAALKHLTPAKAAAVLENWLQGNDPQLQVFAATRLGEVGDEKSVAALAPMLRDDNSLMRQIAANSLAKIGGASSLITAYLEGNDGIKQAAATAIVSYGDETSQQALASVLTRGSGLGNKTARDVIVDSLRRPAQPR